MGQVAVTLNGRTYSLRCGEGEEARLQALASYVAKKIDHLVAEFGQAGDDRLTVMAALLIADELFDARGKAGPESDRDLESKSTGDDATESTAPDMKTGSDLTQTSAADPDDVTSPLDGDHDSATTGENRPEPLLKRALRRSQARAAQSPRTLEERLAAAREGSQHD